MPLSESDITFYCATHQGDWRTVGRILGVRVFTSSARKWTPNQRALIAEALERSAEKTRRQADLDWQAQEFFPYSPPVPIVEEVIVPLQRLRARQIRRIDQNLRK